MRQRTCASPYLINETLLLHLEVWLHGGLLEGARIQLQQRQVLMGHFSGNEEGKRAEEM